MKKKQLQSQQTNSNQMIFYQFLGNTLVASVLNAFIWFSLTFWVYLQTESVLATSLLAGIFAVTNMGSAFIFGNFVDKYRKKTAMIVSSCISLVSYALGTLFYFSQQPEVFNSIHSPQLWILISMLIVGSVAGNLRMIALSTIVSILFESNRDKANGLVGASNGISFSITSVLSGFIIGFYGMNTALLCSVFGTILVLVHLVSIRFSESHTSSNSTSFTSENSDQPQDAIETNHSSMRETIRIIAEIPGLFGLIFFTTFNNFLGGVFMALMDAYGLSLVSVQTWGLLFAVLSFGFIFGSSYIAKYGLGSYPLKSLLVINAITWLSCIFFPIQPSIILLAIGILIWMTLGPFIEATEHTLIQALVPLQKQGRVFGFAQSVESGATPITAFLIGPIAQFFFIPFMTTGAGVELIGSWFGTGASRGIALVFIVSGCIGLGMTFLAFRSRAYRILSQQYAIVSKKNSSEKIPQQATPFSAT